ncbi:MAG TPA: hypothetical protein VHG32_04370 [Thermoanaerobaculia bacterium]|nr:hypothetical protein [Thermoanaerobaculia bacterium]
MEAWRAGGRRLGRCLGGLVLAVAWALAAPLAAAGQGAWAPTGPDGGVVTGLAADPGSRSTLYASTQFGGVFKSTNGGATWAPASSGLDTNGLATIAVSPRGTLLAAAVSGIFRSLDHAASWHRVTLRRQFVEATQFAFDPFSPLLVYAAGSTSGAYKSADGGATWARIGAGLGTPPGASSPPLVQTLAAGPRRGLLLAGSDYGLYRSADGGATWRQVFGTACAAQALLWDPVRPLRAYAGCAKTLISSGSGSQIVVTNDGGLTWQALSGPFGKQGVFSLLAVPHSRLLFAGTDEGIYQSHDSGAHWTPLAAFAATAIPAPAGAAAVAVGALALASTPSPVIYAGSGLSRVGSQAPGAGVWTSSDLGTAWAASSAGLSATAVQAMAIDYGGGPANNVKLYAGTALGVYRSRNGGAAWRKINSGLTDPNVTALAVWSPSTLPPGPPPPGPAALYAVSSFNLLAVSLDAGNSWTERAPLPTFGNTFDPHPVTSVAVDPLDAMHILVGAGNAVYQSRDAGVTWDSKSVLPPSGSAYFVTAIAYAPSQPATVYAVATWQAPFGVIPANGIYQSLDGGTTWAASGQNELSFQSVAIDPVNAGTVYVGGSGAVYLSGDGGATWTSQDFPTAGAFTGLLLVGGPSTYFLIASLDQPVTFNGPNVGLTGPPVWARITSTPGTWGVLGTGLPVLLPTGVSSLVYDPLRFRLYAGTKGAGVWSLELVPPP